MTDLFTNIDFRVKGRALTPSQLKKLSNTLFRLLQSQSGRKLSIVYRGELISSMLEKIAMKEVCDKIGVISSFLFMIGDKGRYYRGKYREQVKSKDKLYEASDISDKIFKGIFDKIKKAAKNTNNKPLMRYFQKNVHQVDFFRDAKNKGIFISRISLLNEDEKLIVRDYYLTKLHQMGKVGFYNNSFYVSTSKRFNIANDFSDDKDGIIIVSWVHSTRSPSINKQVSLLKRTDLPRFNGAVYTRQRELSLTGGILPHFILGYIVRSENRFEINPSLFSDKRSVDEIIIGGIEIDQSDFSKKIESSDYEGYFILTDNNDVIDFF